MDLERPTTKSVWVAMLLAAFSGPLGMSYSTVTGALVMFIVTLFLAFFVGGVSVWVALVVCIAWAGLAARNS